MTETIHIPAFEHGVVHVFDGRFPSEAALRAYALPDGAEDGTAGWPLRDELGGPHLEARGVEAFPITTLKGMGLPSYLTMAYGVSEADAAHPQIAEAAGCVILIASRAFGGRAATLTVPERLRHLGAYRDADAHAAPRPVPSLGGGGAAETTGGAAAAPPEAARPAGGRGRRIAGAGAMALGALLVGAGILASEWMLWLPGLAVAAGGALLARRAPGGPG